MNGIARAMPGSIVLVIATACGPAVTIDDGEPSTEASNEPLADDDGMPGSSVTHTSGSASDSGPVTTGTALDDGWGTGYEDDGGSDEGCTFTCPNPPVPPGGGSGQCAVETQNCPRGEKCMPWSNDGGPTWNAVRCAPVSPTPGQLYEPCMIEGSFLSGVDTCDKGLICLANHANPRDASGICHALCAFTCPDPEQACVELFDGAMPLCTKLCDPLEIGACGEHWSCGSIFADNMPLAFACMPIPVVPISAVGAPCAGPHVCEAGSFCASVDGCPEAECCASACDLDMPACAAGETCVPGGAIAGSAWDHIGTCTPD